MIVRATHNGPTGHEIDMSVSGAKPPALTTMANQLALKELRKVALTHGIDLRRLVLSDSGDASDTDTGTVPSSAESGGAPLLEREAHGS